jgi:molybdopterin-containing oxidoreductase family iron-sulfur binding subunit
MSIRNREGRAVKAEGNPLSPVSHGALCSRGQASLHGLYNPDRVRAPLLRNGEAWERTTWDDAEQRLAAALTENRGRSVFLTEGLTGSMDRLVDEFCTAFGIERVRWQPFAHEPVRAGYRIALGVDGMPVHDFSRADVVLSFGADFMETWGSPIDYSHGFVRAHAYDSAGRRGRFISVTPHQSLTDLNADEWLAVRPGTEHIVALAMARVIVDAGADAGGAAVVLQSVNVAQAAQAAELPEQRLREIAAAFANGGRSIAVGPGVASTHAAATAVGAAVAVLNSVAGNIGRTVHLDRREEATSTAGSYAEMQALIQRLRGGEVGALLVHGANPLYAMPEADGVEDGLGRVAFIASFSCYPDETSQHAHVLLPDHHFLESWDDHVPRTGVSALVQPVMMPVFDTKQTGDVLLSTAARAGVTLPVVASTYYDYLRMRWTNEVRAQAGDATGDFEDWWRRTLQVGFVTTATSGVQAPDPTVSAPALDTLSWAPAEYGGEGEYTLVVYPSYKYWDGRMANRPWLQELPDPVSKFAWSSWVEVHPETAESLGLDTGHIAEVETAFGRVELPVWRHPGVRRDVIAIQLGQGHTALGTYAVGRGVNAVRLLGAVAEPVSGSLVWSQTRAALRSTGNWERPIQQGLTDDQHGREVAHAMTLNEAREKDRARGFLVAAAAPVAQEEEEHEPAAGGHGVPDVHPFDSEVTNLQSTGGFAPEHGSAAPQAYPPPDTHYGEYSQEHPRWGMSIDLERCIGCSACMTACYAENNIGIVGPEQVAKGRILHWIRIERYFEGEGDDLQTRFLPMLCQHCGNAPCEPVCPVFAAYHTPDGLNAQVYNRCVGTRYCANNCPYKVRYFNYYSYEWPEPLNWQLNPDVTVREKGVMEKCTFCVQRIRGAEDTARLEGRGVRDGEIQPACAQTCPGNAITFGNLKDPAARVTQIAGSGRGYRVLESLNTQSAIVYLAKVVSEASEV